MTTFFAESPPTFAALLPLSFATNAPASLAAIHPQVYALYLELEAGGVIELEDGATVLEIEESPGGTAWAAESPATFKAKSA